MIFEDLQIFLTALLALTAGASPYAVNGFYSPPWALLAYAPLYPLPLWVAACAWFAASVVGLWAVARRSFTVGNALWFMLSYVTLDGILYGNLDWLMLLGLIAPSGLDMVLLSLKPQIAFGVMLNRFIHSDKRARLLWPVLALSAASVVLYGPWFMVWLRVSDDTAAWNNAPFPWFAVFGVGLLFHGITQDDDATCLMAALCITPYFGRTSSMLVNLYALEKYPRWAWIGVILQWIFVIIQRLDDIRFYSVW